MPNLSLALRIGGALASTSLLACLVACSAQPTLNITMPTMAPDQSLSQACAISGDEVTRITDEVEQQLQKSIDQANAELASGTLPSLELLTEPIDSAIADVEMQITNPEVLDAIGSMRTSVQGFSEIEKPQSALGYPGYLSALGTQLNEVAAAGDALQKLCIEDTHPQG